MARNRQRAKQRQAERRARRLAEQGGSGPPARAGAPPDDAGARRGPARRAEPSLDDPALGDPTVVEPSPAVDPELAVGAPPEEEGRSDTVLDDEPELDDADEHLELDEVEAEHEAEAAEGYAPRGRRAAHADEPARRGRSRVVQFLIAVWAELQRVQWPNRQALTTLTGVVLGFVLIAGGYLGLLDAIFSRLIRAIL